jgi:hypothetical protein
VVLSLARDDDALLAGLLTEPSNPSDFCGRNGHLVGVIAQIGSGHPSDDHYLVAIERDDWNLLKPSFGHSTDEPA